MVGFFAVAGVLGDPSLHRFADAANGIIFAGAATATTGLLDRRLGFGQSNVQLRRRRGRRRSSGWRWRHCFRESKGQILQLRVVHGSISEIRKTNRRGYEWALTEPKLTLASIDFTEGAST